MVIKLAKMNWLTFVDGLSKLTERAVNTLDYIDQQVEVGLGKNYFGIIDDFEAFQRGEVEVAWIAGLDQYNEAGLQPLHYAIAKENSDAVNWLLQEGASVWGKTEHEAWNTAHFAIANGKCQFLDRLNAHGPEILRELDVKNRTPLLLALELDSLVCVKELLKLQVPLDARFGPTRETYLHAGVKTASVGTLEVLLQAMLNQINYADETGTTSAVLAASLGKLDQLRLLIHYGANLMPVDANGNNILHRAVLELQLGSLDLLLRQKVGIKRFPSVFNGERAKDIKNRSGQIFGDFELSALLKQFNALQFTPLMLAVEQSHEDIVRLLAKTQSTQHINLVRPVSGNAAIHLIALGNRPNALAVLEALLEGRPEVDLVNGESMTALMIADSKGAVDVADALTLLDDF